MTPEVGSAVFYPFKFFLLEANFSRQQTSRPRRELDFPDN
jgi:hypothetical protein